MSSPDDQPSQSPDLGAAVQLDNADTLDGPVGGADALDAGYVPPDRPYGLDEDGVTGAGMRAGDSLDERLQREQPDDLPVEDDRARPVVVAADPDADAEVEEAASDDRAFEEAAEDLGESTGRHALRDPADRMDAVRDAGGAAAPASGRDDVGPGSGL